MRPAGGWYGVVFIFPTKLSSMMRFSISHYTWNFELTTRKLCSLMISAYFLIPLIHHLYHIHLHLTLHSIVLKHLSVRWAAVYNVKADIPKGNGDTLLQYVEEYYIRARSIPQWGSYPLTDARYMFWWILSVSYFSRVRFTPHYHIYFIKYFLSTVFGHRSFSFSVRSHISNSIQYKCF